MSELSHRARWLGSLREWGADRIDALATALWSLANRLRPVYEGPLCPDCRIGPDVGDNCPVCADLFEQKRRDEALLASGYEQGREAAERAVQGEGWW